MRRHSLRDVESGQQIGGENIVVEIDKSKFTKRKYNRGHKVSGGWVLKIIGGREILRRTTAKCLWLLYMNVCMKH